MGDGFVQVAGAWQFASPMAGIPAQVRKTQERPKASYYDDRRRRHKNYSNMMYTFV